MLTPQELDTFQRTGHVTVPSVFDSTEINAAGADIEAWSAVFLDQIRADQRDWYLEQRTTGRRQLRKLDNPVFHRACFRNIARKPDLVEIVEQLIGTGVSVFFSQVFLKPPEGGGPKPLHQDNFYFGPDDEEATLTVWIAVDDATVENGCLYYCDGSHRGAVLDHVAPSGEPFNLQVPPAQAERCEMTAAPVLSGGVSIHHGNSLHQSSTNTSRRPRRAVAMHYLRNDARLVRPALEYDRMVSVRIT